MHEGHRKRILEKIIVAEGALAEHELLEILLFNAIPRQNTNPIAHRLIQTFGSLYGVLQAPREQLLEVEGVGDATASYLKCVSLIFERLERVEQKATPFYSLSDFTNLIEKRFHGVTDEILEMYCLDASGKVKFIKRYTSYERNRVQTNAEEVSRLIAMQMPKGMVAVHNHPLSSSQPSAQDDAFTAQVEMICSIHGIQFFDHIILGMDGNYSYHRAGRLEKIHNDFSFKNILGLVRVP